MRLGFGGTIVALVVAVAACSSGGASDTPSVESSEETSATVVFNAVVYTVDSDGTSAGAFAYDSDGVIVAVGSALGHDDTTGSIEIGKFADYVIVDQNLFGIAPERIDETEILATVVAGNIVYQADGFST